MTCERWSAGAVLLVLAQLVVSAGCSGGGGGTASGDPTRAEVFAAVTASTSPDSDNDGLPDDVELRYHAALGTDAARADSDGDGVNDAMELFGASWVYLQTEGQAGVAPGATAAGQVGDPALPHDGDTTDSDGDGVPDLLEFAGYHYAWATARFVLDPAGFRTDPLQWSTDQDAYSDGMEASGLNMDVAVREPGSHPLVPAYPDIQVELMGYTVTLNDQITYGQGNSIASETSWSREVERTHAVETEVGLELKVGASISLTDLGCSMEVTSSFSTATTDTTSVSSATGGSVLESSEWSQTRSHSPTDAARLKLYVKVRNLGTAPASNVIPTLSLRIGGADVATFEPPSLSVATLLPGGVFPPDEDVNWVIDTVADGTPISLTDWELRALESRAPIGLSVAQKRADVMRLDPQGSWVRVGDAGDYLARILSVTTDLFADVGAGPDGVEGNFIHARVASDDTPTSPTVTLAEALAWSMNFRVEGDHYAVDLRKLDGSVVPVALTGTLGEGGELLDDGEWRWQVDALTIARNWLVPPPVLELEDLLSMRLGPASRISLRAPRRTTEPGPVVHSAWATPTNAGYQVVTCVSDYDGLAQVLFVDGAGATTELRRDGRGPFFYSGSVTGELVGNGTERILAVSTRTIPDTSPPEPLTTEAPVRVTHTPKALPPVVEDVSYTPTAGGGGRFYARVRPATAGITWVRVYHPSYLRAQTGEAADGYMTLQPVSNPFDDPYGYDRRTFWPGWPGWQSGQRVVAYSADLLYTVVELDTADDYRAYRSGTLTMSGAFDWTGTDEWWIQQTDLERGPPAPVTQFYTESNSYGNPGTLLDQWIWTVTGGQMATWTLATHGLSDIYLRDSQWACGVYYLGFFTAGARAPGDGADYFAGITRRTITNYKPLFAKGWLPTGPEEALFEPLVNNVFMFQTPEGRLGKLLVTSRWGDESGWPYENCWTTINLRYTIFVKAGD